MKKPIKIIIWGLSAGLVLALAAGLGVMWPFLTYPQTTVSIDRLAPLQVPAQEQFMAGIGVRDITTPIGIPKMGYSAWARQADGFRTRLKARAFYLKPVAGEPMVVIQADLPASSLLLLRKVSEAVARQTDVAFHNISLHATHTHSGPGQYFSSDFYNIFGSDKPGFDPDVFEFLVSQIADAVIAAFQQQRPAKVAIGTQSIYGVTKNRAMGAYVKNNNVAGKQQNDAAALRAVNPQLTLVRIDGQTDSGEFKPMGAFSTFAIHGTGIPPFTHPYHGDVWAFFERDLEQRIASHYQPPWQPVHGPFEANHADNNPNYRKGMRGDSETRRIGLALSDQAWQIFSSLDSQLTDQVRITTAQRELDLLDPVSDPDKLLCERAIAGTAIVGAAKDDEVFPVSYIPWFQRGWPDSGERDCHREKRWMLSGLQQWALAPSRYPHKLVLHVFQLNELLLVGLPFEITLEAGNRIGKAVTKVAPESVEQVVVSSHSNGFFGYSVTDEEYSAQWYEGGHTLYGPRTTEFLARQSARLVKDMSLQPGLSEMPESWAFSLVSRHFFPQERKPEGQRMQVRVPRFVAGTVDTEPYWQWDYVDVATSDMELHQPLMQIEASADGEHFTPLMSGAFQPVSDEGYDMQIRYLEDLQHGMARYQLRWYNPQVAIPGQWFRFQVAPRSGLAEITSSAFR
ncbi:MAG: hypothetical protein D6160_05870 [Ketobacter sp.]|nr:MAG: hypothetical protein D6160_05870 [Ketobacter sp.]